MATQITANLPTLDFPLEADYPTQEDWAAFSAAAEENFGILGGSWSTQMQLWKTEANAMSTELNNNADLAQSIANYQGDWVSQGYTLGQTVSVSGVYYICKLTHASGQNPTDVSSLYWNLALGNWNLKVNTNMSSYTSKVTPVDADLLPLSDSDASFGIKKLSWANLKTALSSFFMNLTSNQTIAGVKTFSSTITGSINGNAATVTNGVYTTGNQTIAGVKTFSSSPIVPTPTAGTQVVNKDYADLKVSLESFIGTNQSKSANGYQKLPGGLVIQWGTIQVTAVNGGYIAALYPIRFPNSCFVAIGGRYAPGSNAVMLVGKAGGDPEGQVIFQNFGASSEIGSYIAIGS